MVKKYNLGLFAFFAVLMGCYNSVFVSSFLYDKSVAIAPSGAVMSIAITAQVRTMFPQDNPEDRGIAPIAA